MKVLISLREALQDDALLGQAISGPSWAIWRALLLATMGEALTEDERELFSSVTGRSQEPLQRVEEFWAIAGRRSGKTRAAAVLGSYVATCIDWSDVLAVGERGVIPVLAASTYQAGRAFQHINAVLTNSTDLSEMLDGDPTADTIRLTNRIDINVVPANFKTIRSITAVAILCDEIAFWHIEGSRNPDHEILTAARPALATTEGPLIGISSPYARRGELWNVYRKDYGSEGDPLIVVAKGASRTFNPTLKQATIDRAYERDPGSAVAEYGGEFRTDVEALLVREVVEELIEVGISERPPMPGVTYRAFVDPSGGSTDAMTLAIAHKDRDVGVLDLVCEVKPPFSPEAVVERFDGILKPYGISTVKGDRYAGEWAREPFRRKGITYEISELSRSDLYLALVPAINSGRVRLLDNDRLTGQLVALERKTSRTGRDIVDHPPGGHDDIANAAAGALIEATDSDSFDADMWAKLAS